MFRLVCGENIKAAEIFKNITGHENVGFGNPYIVEKPITTFFDCIANPRQLEYNPYNIFIQLENRLSPSVKEWLMDNYHVFSFIMSNDIDILNCANENSVEIPYTNLNSVFDFVRNTLLLLIEDHKIPESIYWSQEMEDRWINENLEIPDIGVFLDIGGCYPKIISNTYFFEKYKNWSGLMIEPDPSYFQLLKDSRTCFLEQKAISTKIGKTWFMPMTKVEEIKSDASIEVECARLDTLLEKYNIKNIDLISIDIEGYEKDAWATFDYKKYNPKIIITEHTEFGRFDNSFSNQILMDTDYYVIHTTPLNHIIIHKDVKLK